MAGSLATLAYKRKQPAYIQTMGRMEEIRQKLNVPVHESDLYLKSSYEDEKKKIASLENEYASLEKNIEEKFSSLNRAGTGLALGGFSTIPGIMLLLYGFDKRKYYKKSLAENQ